MKISTYLSAVVVLLLVPFSFASTRNVSTTAATITTTNEYSRSNTTTHIELQETLSSSSSWLDYEIIQWTPPSVYLLVNRRLQEQQQQQQVQELVEQEDEPQAQEQEEQIEASRETIPEADDLIVTVTFRDICKNFFSFACWWWEL